MEEKYHKWLTMWESARTSCLKCSNCKHPLSLSQISLGPLTSLQHQDTMGSKAPSWGEQWSAEGYGGNDDDDRLMNKVGNSSGSKMGDVKAAASAGLGKAKAAASVSAQKVKSGTSVGIKWVKTQYQKKVSK
nr:hypothetical protein CFP56_49604 [Quercus suber]